MCFLINGSSYSFETCTIVIGMPENLRVCWVWPCKYKRKWCFSPKCVFSATDHHTAFETCTIAISTPENLRVHWGWPSKYKGRWCFSPKCVFSEMDHHTGLKLVILQSAHLKTSGCTEFGPLDTKKVDVLVQNVFSHKWIINTALKLVPLWLSCLKTPGCAELGPVNTKESNVLAPNIFSQKWIIIQLWNLYHCNWHAWKPQGALSLAL